jgi:hypothetical protein
LTLPQRNAKLLQVNAAGGTPDWDSPDDLGDEKFKGKVDAYYNEKRALATGVSQGAESTRDLITRRSLTVEAGRPGVDFEQGDVVRFTYRRRRGGRVVDVEKTGVVETVEERDMPGYPVLGTVRLTLQPE